MENQEYNIQLSIKGQKEQCEKTGAPHFAPKSGVCWKCRKNIYTPHKQIHLPGTQYESELTTGISIEKASSQLVTGCPHCNRSYCD